MTREKPLRERTPILHQGLVLKRLLAALSRGKSAAPNGAGVDAWSAHDAGDLLPPHDFQVLADDPDVARGIVAFNAGAWDQALEALGHVTPRDDATRMALGLLRAHALREAWRFDDALTTLDALQGGGPDPARALALRGDCLLCLGRYAEAIKALEAARLAAGPRARGIALLAGQLAQWADDWDGAITEYRRSLEDHPHIAFARSQLGYALIRAGHHREGYLELRRVGFDTRFLPMEKSSPVWNGEATDARPLLLVAEFGLGDMVQYLRYAGALRQRMSPGTPLWLKAPMPLHRLAGSTGWFDRVLAPHEEFTGGMHSPLMQLPLLLGMEDDTRPLPFPYLQPGADDLRRFDMLLANRNRPRVGLCWAGKRIEIDARRSLPFATLRPLVDTFAQRVDFINLQAGEERHQASDAPFTDPPDAFVDVANTAALCANLDLVICVDTAIAHIAGAMAVPTWVLSRPDVDWRWETPGRHEGQPSLGFYPQTRLFRHPHGELDWVAVVRQAGLALDAWLRDFGHRTK